MTCGSSLFLPATASLLAGQPFILSLLEGNDQGRSRTTYCLISWCLPTHARSWGCSALWILFSWQSWSMHTAAGGESGCRHLDVKGVLLALHAPAAAGLDGLLALCGLAKVGVRRRSDAGCGGKPAARGRSGVEVSTLKPCPEPLPATWAGAGTAWSLRLIIPSSTRVAPALVQKEQCWCMGGWCSRRCRSCLRESSHPAACFGHLRGS